MITLLAGVTWLGAAPAAAYECRDRPALCDDLGRIHLGKGGGRKAVPSQGDELALSAARMAERIGLTGLASVRSAMGLSDLGGLAATSAMPALSPGTPARAGLPSLTKLPDVPDLPSVAGVRDLPVGMSISTLPDPATAAGKSAQAPVDEVTGDLIERTLPQVPTTVDELTGGTRLPDTRQSLDGLTGLLPGLGHN